MPKRLILTAGCVVLLAGCQGMSAAAPPSHQDPMANAPPITQGFDATSLSQVLLSEIAGQRGDFRRAVDGYAAAAERYRSPALAKRATLAARYTNDSQLLTATASLWQTLAPDDSEAAALLSDIAIDQGDWITALEQRLRLAQRGNEARLLEFADLALQARTDPEPLLSRLEAFSAERPEHADAQMATARLEAATGEVTRSLERLDSLTQRYPEQPLPWLTRSQIALESSNYALAASSARRGQELAPGDSRFLLALAQALIVGGDPADAEQPVAELLKRHDRTPNLRVALARVYLDADAPEPARRLLLPLLDRDATPPEAQILLGNIAERQGEPDNALLYYRQVPPGPGFLDSRALATQMLVAEGRIEDARRFVRLESLRHAEQRATLTRLGIEALDAAGQPSAADSVLADSLAEAPDDRELRYTLAMRQFEHGNVDTMMAQLREIIAANPDHAASLNALGYTLATHTEHYAEALELIERAHEIAPQSSAILDSLGWVHFKLGDVETAVGYLRRAYAGQPDQEVAAHLAEALLTQGDTTAARELVSDALARNTAHPDLNVLLQRFPQLAPQPSSDSTGRPDAKPAPSP